MRYKGLIINESEIIADENCQIIIDLDQFHEKEVVDDKAAFFLPGILDIQLLDSKTIVNLPFLFTVKLFKKNMAEITSKKFSLNYEKGDIILFCEYKEKESSVQYIDRLLEQRVKYIKDPQALSLALWKNILPVSNVSLVHCESVISELYRSKENNALPARLAGYDKSVPLGMTNSVRSFTTAQGVSEGYSELSIEQNITNDKKMPLSTLEKVMFNLL